MSERYSADAAVAAVLRRLEAEAKNEFLPIIGPAKAEFLATLVRNRQPQLAVEIGSMRGYSAIVIAAQLPPNGRLIGVEIDAAAASIAQQNVAEAGLAERVEIRRGDATSALGGLNGPIDLLLLDGRRSGYLGCVQRLGALFAPRAVIVANGTGLDCRGCESYLDHMRAAPEWLSRSRSFGEDAMEISVRV